MPAVRSALLAFCAALVFNVPGADQTLPATRPAPAVAAPRPTYLILIDVESLDAGDASKACMTTGAFVDRLDPDDRVVILSVSTLRGKVEATTNRLTAGTALESIMARASPGAINRRPAVPFVTGAETPYQQRAVSLSLTDAIAIAGGDVRTLDRVRREVAAARSGNVNDVSVEILSQARMIVAATLSSDNRLTTATTQLLERPREDAGRLVVVWITNRFGPAAADPAGGIAQMIKTAVSARVAISVLIPTSAAPAAAYDAYRSLAAATGGIVVAAVESVDAATQILLKTTSGPETRRADPAGISELTSLRRSVERRASGSAYLALVQQYRTGDADAAVQTLMSWRERIPSEIRPLPSLAELEAAVAMHTEVAIRSSSPAHLGISRRGVAALISRRLGTGTIRRWFLIMAAYSKEEARKVEEMPDAGSDAALMVALGSLLEFPTVADREGQSDFGRPKPPAADSSRAADLYRAALAIDNGLAEARLRLGRVLWMLHQPGEATTELERARAEARESGSSYLASLFLGEIDEATGDGKAAVAAYRAAIQSCPDALAARVALAHLLQSSGQFVEAGQIVRPALSVRPGNTARDPWQEYVWGSPAHVERDLSALREAVRK